MIEYLRRAALWAENVSAEDQWPFFDIAAHIAPTIRADAIITEALEQISPQLSFPEVRQTVNAMVNFAALLDTPEIQRPDLPHPYEPLLLMFERGGGFIIYKGFIDVVGQLIQPETWQERINSKPLESLEPTALDALDKR